MHLYLTSDATCVHCGLKFDLAWRPQRGEVMRPTLRNLVLGLTSGGLMALATATVGAPIDTLFLIGLVLFMTRVILGVLEMYARHVFISGVLGPLVKRAPYNIIAPLGHAAMVGRVKFPMGRETHSHFQEGETLLVEHLRWSRIPVAIYLGTHPGSKG